MKTETKLLILILIMTGIVLLMTPVVISVTTTEKFSVDFEVYASLDHIWRRDCITNNQDSNDDFAYITILNETNINVSAVDGRLFEEKTEEYLDEVADTIQNETCHVNGTCYNETIIIGYHNETRERTILLERNLVQRNEDGQKGEISHQFEEVHIKKQETKCFWMLYQLPEVPTHPDGWGSYGMTYIITKDEIHFDKSNSSWWDASCNEGTNILIDGNGIARDKTYFWLNITGITAASNFTAQTRLVNTSCDNGGSEAFMKIHQNGTDSVLITGSTTDVPGGSNGSACLYHDCSFTTAYDMMDFKDVGNLSFNGTGYPNVTGSEWADAPSADLNFGKAARDAVDKEHLKLNISNPAGASTEDYHGFQAFGGTTSKTKATLCAVFRVEDLTDDALSEYQAITRMQGFGTGTETEFRLALNTTTMHDGVAGGLDASAPNTDYHYTCLAIAAKTTGEAYLDNVLAGNTSGFDANDAFATQIGDISSTGSDVLTTYWSFWWMNTTDYLPPPTVSVGSSVSQSTSQINVTLNFPANDTWNLSSTVNFGWTPDSALNYTNCSLWITDRTNSNFAVNITNTSAITNNTVNTIPQTLADGNYTHNIQCCDSVSACNFSIANFTFRIDTTNPISNSPADQTHFVDEPRRIEWIPQDNMEAGNYTVFRDGVIQNVSTMWNNNTNLIIWVDTRTVGTFNYSVNFTDSTNHSGQDDVSVSIILMPEGGTGGGIPDGYQACGKYEVYGSMKLGYLNLKAPVGGYTPTKTITIYNTENVSQNFSVGFSENLSGMCEFMVYNNSPVHSFEYRHYQFRCLGRNETGNIYISTDTECEDYYNLTISPITDVWEWFIYIWDMEIVNFTAAMSQGFNILGFEILAWQLMVIIALFAIVLIWMVI